VTSAHFPVCYIFASIFVNKTKHTDQFINNSRNKNSNRWLST